MPGERPIAIFLFHRDLRLEDNTALCKAIEDGYQVLPLFVFPPEQIDPRRNRYFCHAAVQFMCECLKGLDASFRAMGGSRRLWMFRGDTQTVLATLVTSVGAQAVYSNEDYSMYARKRDARLKAWCESHGVLWRTAEDYGLFGLHEGLVEDDPPRPYMVLAMYYKRYLKDLHVRAPNRHRVSPSDVWAGRDTRVIAEGTEVRVEELDSLYTPVSDPIAHGGRKEAQGLLRRVAQGGFRNYAATRDLPALAHGTTRASPHLKFGTMSIREFYGACTQGAGSRDHPLIRELIFRDFYMKIYGLRPELQRDVALMDGLDKAMPWRYDKTAFRAWCEGRTGYPLVDAGMRQLAATGWMHNRVRMVVGTFLTKYLLIDWRWGLRHFARQLVDGDAYSNAAGWQWCASVGADAQPWFRAPMNPFLQSQKYDPDARYIQRWVPELRGVQVRDIHRWDKAHASYPMVDYPAPMVEQKEASSRAMRVFKEAFANSRQEHARR